MTKPRSPAKSPAKEPASVASPNMTFSLATPITGPASAPAYIDFSPLFNSSGGPLSTPQQLPRVPIRKSPRLDAHKPHLTSTPIASIFSPSAFFSTGRHGPVPDLDHFPSAGTEPVPFAITGAQHDPDADILGRYQRFAQQHGGRNVEEIHEQMSSLQTLQGKKRPRYVGSGLLEPPVWNGMNDGIDNYAMHHPSNIIVPHYNHNDDDVSSSPTQPKMTPKTRVPVGAGGSSCHQCKNRRDPHNLNFCMNRNRPTHLPKKKVCRKKFCDQCLVKFSYISHLRHDKSANDWECPSCVGLCGCAACKRKHTGTEKPPHKVQRVSPTLTFAQKILSDPAFMSKYD